MTLKEVRPLLKAPNHSPLNEITLFRWLLCCWCCSSTISSARHRAILTTGSALALTHHHGCLRSVKKGLVGVGAVRKISNWFCIFSQFHLPTVSNNLMNRGFNIVVQCPPNQDCEEFSPSERSHVEGGIEECMQLCQVKLFV